MDQQREVMLFKQPDRFQFSSDEKKIIQKRKKFLDAYAELCMKQEKDKLLKEQHEFYLQQKQLQQQALFRDIDEEEQNDDFPYDEDDFNEENEEHDSFPSRNIDKSMIPPNVNNPLASSTESDGPIEFALQLRPNGTFENQQTIKDRFLHR